MPARPGSHQRNRTADRTLSWPESLDSLYRFCWYGHCFRYLEVPPVGETDNALTHWQNFYGDATDASADARLEGRELRPSGQVQEAA